MAALSLRRDERGAVYVEFLLAFLPIFLMFLAICQVAFLVAGRLVVNHAAFAGARSAIVVLEDDPQRYAGAERGRLSDKPPAAGAPGPLALVSQLISGAPASAPAPSPSKPAQQGLRMQAIRRAALRPLAAIAPTATAFLGGRDGTLQASLEGDTASARIFGRVYTEAAAVVTVHDAPNAAELAAEPIARNAPVAVRVTFVQHCGIPIVRALICRSLSTLLDSPTSTHGGSTNKSPTLRKRLEHAKMPN